jgi:predicted  nucleic acid-binding Zn-ribbon protein
VQEDLRSLLTLQEKDRHIMAVQSDLDALQPELKALDEELRAVEDELANARKRATDIAQQREALEGKIESYRVMQERRRQKLEWVRGAKEAATLMAEIDLARSVLAKEEAEWLRSADGVQKAEALAGEIEQRLEALKVEQAPRRSEIAEQHRACEGRLQEAKDDRAGSVVHVKIQLLTQYERIRKGRAPLAVYPLHGGACGHCYTNIPLHLRQQIAQNEGAATCEACGVLIYVDA